MAKEPASVLVRWQELEHKKINIPPEVWEQFDRQCLSRMNDILALLQKAEGRDLDVDDAKAVVISAMAVQKFVSGISSAETGVSAVRQDRILMDRVALDLVHHYIGNDLYKVVLMADVYDGNPQPIPSSQLGRILECIHAVRGFLQRLRSATT